MEAFDQHYDQGGPSVPTISLVGPTPTKRKRKSTADTATPAAGRVSDPPAPPKSKSSSKKRKSKDVHSTVDPPAILAPLNPPATLAEIPLTLSSPPPPPPPPAQPMAPTSNASVSLAFSAVALAQAKRQSDMSKKKEKRSKSSSDDEDANDAPREKEKETKEERKKRKEEKRRRREEKKSKAAEGKGDDAEKEKKKKKDRKRKSREKDGAEGKEGKKSKKHKKSTTREDGIESPQQAQAEAEPSVATNFTQVVSSFMAQSAAASSSAVSATPATANKQSKGTETDAAAGQGPTTPSGQKSAPTAPSSKKDKKDKKKGKETAVPRPQQPFPSRLAPSSPALDRDPMDVPSSPVPEGDPMDATSSPVSSPDRPTHPRIVLSETPIDPALSRETAQLPSGGHATTGVAGAKANGSAVVAAETAPKKNAAAATKGRKKKEDAFDEAEDEALRERLKDPAARHEFLSSKWVDIPILLRLEKKGIITWKRGKYTESERAAVRSCLDTFCKTHGLNDQELIDVIFAKGRSSNARSKYPGFWADVAQVVPGRPLRYVKEAVQRMYHPNAHKGAWTKEEDEALQRAYTETPGAWVKIGEAVGRPYTDCRDRYTKQIMADDRAIGRWTKEEENQLTEAVKKTAEELGKDMFDGDIPWPTVKQHMGGKRSAHQCRVKWQEFMVPLLTGEGYIPTSSSLLQALRKFGYEHEKDVVWRDVSGETKSHSKGAQAAWRRMRSFVAPVDGKSFKEVLDLIESKMDVIEAGDSDRAASTVARVARNAASAERKAKREAAALKVPSERTWSRSLSGTPGGNEQPSWLEAAGLRVEAAEAWMDNLVASRSASAAAEPAVESTLATVVESPGESSAAPAGAMAGSSEKSKDKPRSRKVSFADDAATAE